jgi:hypothetical protein
MGARASRGARGSSAAEAELGAAELGCSAVEESHMEKRWRHAALLVAIASAVIVLVIWRAWFPGRSFDRAAWQADAMAETGVRKAMADRLLAHRTLVSKTRAEVVDLLGEPSSTEYFREWDLVYRLGMERGVHRHRFGMAGASAGYGWPSRRGPPGHRLRAASPRALGSSAFIEGNVPDGVLSQGHSL